MECLQYLALTGDCRIYVDQLVLNLVINGMPSIPLEFLESTWLIYWCFKPCYKWNAFNTDFINSDSDAAEAVLNLVINGMPSIPEKLQFFGGSFGQLF